ncbi:hypothetical protein FQN57_007449 [Myotisia sp. PD_48]|nr:hypothetical protein FQN57_007449 [Myotisia sp. PD_48]
MFKPTPALGARLRLTTKQVGRGYYKGNRTGSMGAHGAKKGTYFIDWTKVRTYVVPEGLEDFKLTPFVTKRMEPTRTMFTKTVVYGDRERVQPRAYTGSDFLKEWNEENEPEVEELKMQEEELASKSQESVKPELQPTEKI